MGFRDTWHTRKASRGFSQREALGTRGTLGRHPEGSLGARLSGHVAYSEGFRGDSPGWSSRDAWRTRNAPRVSTGWGHSGRRILDQWLRLISQFGPGELDRVALAVGLEIDGSDGSASSDRAIYRATLAVGS